MAVKTRHPHCFSLLDEEEARLQEALAKGIGVIDVVRKGIATILKEIADEKKTL